MEKKFWFDYVDLKSLERYIRKYIIGKIYDMERISNKDAIKICYETRNDDSTYTEYLTPFGLSISDNLEYGYNYLVTNPAVKELFEIMHQATTGILIGGKTYSEAFYEARTNEIRNKYNAKINQINADIEKLEASKKSECEIFFNRLKELEIFVSPIIEKDKNESRLIVKDIIKGMSEEERLQFFSEFGFAPKEDKTDTENVPVINNGLNDVALDF